MKKMYFVWALAMCLMAAGCSKDNDDATNSIEKTYADDDFVMTERNIKEKMIGKWEITQLRTQLYTSEWRDRTGDELGKWKYVDIMADGRINAMGLTDARWQIQGSTVSLFVTYMDGYGADSSEGYRFILGEDPDFATERSKAIAMINATYANATIKEYQKEWVQIKVVKMEKDFFSLEISGMAIGGTCRMKRR